MVRIKVTRGGCGIKYKDANGIERHSLKTPKSGSFDCDDAQAARLVRLGVAAYVNSDGWQQVADPDGDKPAADNISRHFYSEDLEIMDYNDLKKLAADMGVKPSGQKKADYIAAIAAGNVVDGCETDSDELPELTAADPE